MRNFASWHSEAINRFGNSFDRLKFCLTELSVLTVAGKAEFFSYVQIQCTNAKSKVLHPKNQNSLGSETTNSRVDGRALHVEAQSRTNENFSVFLKKLELR